MARNTEPPEGEEVVPAPAADTETVSDAPPIPDIAPSDEPAVEEQPAATIDDLRAEADRRGLRVDGTGKDGRVVKADLEQALDAPVPPAGRPPLILVAEAAAATTIPTED